ncbi:MAG TPA: putative zinc-binding protein [Armatimonadota bacterium]|nr:putative zinc-binding protein [Armatimonadota bacterium]
MADCCCGNGNVLLFACSGGSNVGQISNDAAKALDQLGQGSFFCLSGIGAQLPNFVARIKKDDTTVVAIDGCGMACAKKALDNIGETADVYVVVTDLGIAKGHHFNYTKEEVGHVAQAVSDAVHGAKCCRE